MVTYVWCPTSGVPRTDDLDSFREETGSLVPATSCGVDHRTAYRPIQDILSLCMEFFPVTVFIPLVTVAK